MNNTNDMKLKVKSIIGIILLIVFIAAFFITLNYFVNNIYIIIGGLALCVLLIGIMKLIVWLLTSN
jgi:hypothetical protein